MTLNRTSELKRHEEEILISFTDFIDKNLIVNSNEKRCVGYHLLVEMVQHCPVKSLRSCISKRVVRSLVSARINKKHTLHIIAETTLKSLVLAAKDDNKARLILASCLVQYGGANFDQKSKTHTVQNLLEGLDESDVLSHIKQLCELIGMSLGSQQSVSPVQSSAQINNTNEPGEIEDEPDTFNTVQSVIDAMVSLSKNSNILGRYNVVVLTSLILLRLSYFSNCVNMKNLLQGTNSKTNKKETKKERSSIGASANKMVTQLALQIFGDSSDHDTCLTITEAFECLDLVNNGSDTSNLVFTDDIANYASTKFLSLLSDSGHKNYFQLSNMPSKPDVSIKSSTDNSLLQVVTNTMALMIGSDCKLRADTGLNGEDSTFDLAIKSALDYQKQLKSFCATNLPKHLSDKDVTKYVQLSDSLISFISHAIFSVLSSDNGEIEVRYTLKITSFILILLCLILKSFVIQALGDLGRVCIDLVQNQCGLTKNEDSDDDDDDNENPQMKMFELTMDFLSAPEDQSIRGIREVIKKVWIHIASVFPILDEVIDSVVSVITNDNDDDDENESVQDDDEDEEDEEEKEDDEEAELDDDNDANHDEEVNKEIIVHEDSMFELLDGEDDLDNLDDMEGMLMHEGTPEQDSALAQLIELRKKSRKLGLLSAQKHQFLIRTRAVDILDILANHLSIDRLLLLIPPFIKTLKSVYASSTLMNMQECLSFCSKLKSLIEEKICKGKHHKKKDKEGNISAETSTDNKSIAVCELSNEEVTKILEEIFICVKSSIAPLKHVASGCLFRLCRVILLEHFSEMAEVVDILNMKTLEMLDDFKNKKNSKVSRKLFEELFSRFPDFAVSCLVNPLIDGCSESKSIYIQTECCDILTSVLSRFKSLSSVSQQFIVQQSAHNLISITKTTETLCQQAKQDTTISSVCGKRLKTFLLCGKVVLQNIKMNSTTNHTPDKHVVSAIQLFATSVNDLSQMVQSESSNKNKAPNSNVLASLTSIAKNVIQLITDLNLSKLTNLESPSSSKKRIKQAANENTDEKRRKKK